MPGTPFSPETQGGPEQVPGLLVRVGGEPFQMFTSHTF